ncbi:tyrosine-type recombinase/integrase [Streptomyces sp. NP160]|uniref:tyrosine-type recombinase/integrase n=1 Tax=Streptomyces sp. NP160 TaxID=2586637 RepID=UPI0015D595E6|nr:tyrosine-type recombinase/integrase [Streptomyces sp. NP160]
METNTRPGGGAAEPLTVNRAWEGYVAGATVDPKTMSVYDGVYRRHVAPSLGDVPVAGVTREDVVRLLDGLRARGSSSSLVRLSRTVLGAACRYAQAQCVIGVLPTEGVSAPHAEVVVERVLTPGEYLRVREGLPTAGARLLADLLVRSGLRIGEALALQRHDVGRGELLVRRCLSEPGRRFSADGQRFVLRPSTKNGEPRSVPVGEDFCRRLAAWCDEGGVGAGELVFPARLVLPGPSGRSFPRKVHTEPLTRERLAGLGTFTGPNGKEYQHGTVNGYVTGRCRDACCRQAISEYSARRRRVRREAQRGDLAPRRSPVAGAEAPVDSAASSGVPGIGAVSHQGWSGLWEAAVRSAGLDLRPLARHTRHVHASWLNSGGVSGETIAERLGHRDERSTRGYVRPVGREADAVAVLDAALGQEAPPRG